MWRLAAHLSTLVKSCCCCCTSLTFRRRVSQQRDDGDVKPKSPKHILEIPSSLFTMLCCATTIHCISSYFSHSLFFYNSIQYIPRPFCDTVASLEDALLLCLNEEQQETALSLSLVNIDIHTYNSAAYKRISVVVIDIYQKHHGTRDSRLDRIDDS